MKWKPRLGIQELEIRIGGTIKKNIPNDAERLQLQKDKLKSQGISKEPIILFKAKDGKYDLAEGKHRTIEAFKMFPEGFIQPNVYIGLNAKWLDENLSKLKEAKLTDSLNEVEEESEIREYTTDYQRRREKEGDYQQPKKDRPAPKAKAPKNDYFAKRKAGVEESMSEEEWNISKEEDRLQKLPIAQQQKIKQVIAMMKAEKKLKR